MFQRLHFQIPYFMARCNCQVATRTARTYPMRRRRRASPPGAWTCWPPTAIGILRFGFSFEWFVNWFDRKRKEKKKKTKEKVSTANDVRRGWLMLTSSEHELSPEIRFSFHLVNRSEFTGYFISCVFFFIFACSYWLAVMIFFNFDFYTFFQWCQIFIVLVDYLLIDYNSNYSNYFLANVLKNI